MTDNKKTEKSLLKDVISELKKPYRNIIYNEKSHNDLVLSKLLKHDYHEEDEEEDSDDDLIDSKKKSCCVIS